MTKPNLNHLALILDGNRRWGKQRGIAMSVDFYIDSGLLGMEIAQAVFDRGIDNLTIWIGSISNLTKRSTLELKALNKAYKKFFSDRQSLDFLHNNHVKADCFGRWRDLLEPSTIEAIDQAIDATNQYADSGKRLTVLIGYDGSDERGAALQKIFSNNSKDELARILTDAKAANETFRANSWTGHLPDVDLIIRTGTGQDPHNSAGFLSLISDNSQYAFLDTLWPDFTPELLNKTIDDFEKRERRMGK